MTEMTSFERELRAALAEADASAAEPTGLAERLVAATTSGTSRPHRSDLRRSRRWLTPLIAAAAVLVVALGTDALVTSIRADRELPAAQNPGLTTPLIAPQSLLDVRELGFHLGPVSGAHMTDSWDIGNDHQSATVVVGSGGPDLSVDMYYQGRSPELPSTGTSEAVSVNGLAGTYSKEIRPDYWAASVAWEYAPSSWAVVSGREANAAPPNLRKKLLAVAEALRSGGESLRVPVRFGAVPASLPAVANAHNVSMSFRDGTWTWWLSVDDVSLWATSRVGGECVGSDGTPQTAEFTYRGHPGCLVAGERIELHLGDADVFFDFGPSPELPIADMKEVLADLTVASDDPTTWYDLKTALGG